MLLDWLVINDQKLPNWVWPTLYIACLVVSYFLICFQHNDSLTALLVCINYSISLLDTKSIIRALDHSISHHSYNFSVSFHSLPTLRFPREHVITQLLNKVVGIMKPEDKMSSETSFAMCAKLIVNCVLTQKTTTQNIAILPAFLQHTFQYQ
jgi:hypothetical protein